jgi:hypothetical protein
MRSGGSVKGSVSPHRTKEDNRNLEDLVNFIEGPKKKKQAKPATNGKQADNKSSKNQKKKNENPPRTTASSSSKKNEQNGHLSVPSKGKSKIGAPEQSSASSSSSTVSSSSKSGHKENLSSNVSPSTSKDKNKKNGNSIKVTIVDGVVKSASPSPSRTASEIKKATQAAICPQPSQESESIGVIPSTSNQENQKTSKKEGKKKGKKDDKNIQNLAKKIEVLSPDEVFKPKDVSLENGELDPVEKELEAFKR